ncbi:hypothetical protein QWY93_12845 [Echinicola jeungdonensis]|uniref:Uncharacterized protein n=1 Tax=Echinicola jeungdonensis TaxID=709343 RepID=A0ABV5JAJ1_9BACT|nr:hypothetical protein [Echinicola jeungdonensis]MDN3670212.1 hypothetical protein [Echinicola jeungdonensis]
MKTLNQLMYLFLMGTILVFSSCNDEEMDPPMEDDSFYATKLGGEEMVPDPANEGEMIEQGYLNLRIVVDGTVMLIAGDEKYSELKPHFNVLLAEVGEDDFSGYNALVEDFTDLLAESTGAKNYSYTGLSMANAHNPNENPRMNGFVDDDDFDLFVEAVVQSATGAGFGSNDILGPIGELLEGTRDAIVQREDGAMLDLYTRLGGTVMVDDGDGNMVEAGYLPLKQVVTETVLLIATNEGGKYDDLQPYFPVLLAEVGVNDLSGFNALLGNFSDFLAQAIGSTNIEYSGMSMADAHNPEVNSRMTGMVTTEDYDLFVQAVVEAVTNKGVPESVIAEFGVLLNSEGLKGAIIQA